MSNLGKVFNLYNLFNLAKRDFRIHSTPKDFGQHYLNSNKRKTKGENEDKDSKGFCRCTRRTLWA